MKKLFVVPSLLLFMFLWMGQSAYAQAYPYIPQISKVVPSVSAAQSCDTINPVPPITPTVAAAQTIKWQHPIWLPLVTVKKGEFQCMDRRFYDGTYVFSLEKNDSILLPLRVDGDFMLGTGQLGTQLVPIAQDLTGLNYTEAMELEKMPLPQAFTGFKHIGGIFAITNTHPAVQAAAWVPGGMMPSDLEEVKMAERVRITKMWLKDGSLPTHLVLPEPVLLYSYPEHEKPLSLYGVCPNFVGQYPFYTVDMVTALTTLSLAGTEETWMRIKHDDLLVATCAGELIEYPWITFKTAWDAIPENYRKLIDVEIKMRTRGWRQTIVLAPNPVFVPMAPSNIVAQAAIQVMEVDGQAIVYMIIEGVQAAMPELYAIFMAP